MAVIDGAPLSMTYGLYQGGKLQAGADQAYRNLLRNAFLPRLIYRIEDRLRSIPATDLEQTYEVLKVYLMLQDRTHLEPDYATAAIEFDWDESLPGDDSTDQRAALGEHLKALLAQDDYSSPLPPDPLLIASALIPTIWTWFVVSAFCQRMLDVGVAGARLRASIHAAAVWALAFAYVVWARSEARRVGHGCRSR